jgi:anaphase-promoting complex subunit 6
MEYLQLSNYSLAEESFQAAKSLFADDPLLLNELGVASYNKNEYVGRRRR